jgi:hypothetical protein
MKIKLPKLVCDPKLYSRYVMFFDGMEFPDETIDASYFYFRDASYLVLLFQERGVITNQISPEFRNELSNHPIEYRATLTEGFKHDGIYLVDFRTGNWLVSFKPDGEYREINWDLFVPEVSLANSKILAIVWSDELIAKPVTMFPETYAPSFLTFVNYKNQFLEFSGDALPTPMGVYILQRIVLEDLDLPVIPIDIVTRNIDTLAPTGKSKLEEGNLIFLTDIVNNAYLAGEDEEDSEEETDNSVEHITLGKLLKGIADGEILASSRKRFQVNVDELQLDFEFSKIIYRFGGFFVHVPINSQTSKERVKEQLGIPEDSHITFVPTVLKGE